jgi:hypothetical protein
MTMVSRLFARCTKAADAGADKRIFCDCELTLLKEDNSAHEDVLGFLIAAQRQGYEIILISTNVNFVQFAVEDCLSDNGYSSDRFGYVQPKCNAYGTKAFIVIDDKPESVSGIETQYSLLPDDPSIPYMTAQLTSGGSLQITPSV